MRLALKHKIVSQSSTTYRILMLRFFGLVTSSSPSSDHQSAVELPLAWCLPRRSLKVVAWNGRGLSLLCMAIFLKTHNMFFAGMTSLFHTVLQEDHLRAAWILDPVAVKDKDLSLKLARLLLWLSAHTCEVKHSSIMIVDANTLRLESDFKCCRSLLGAHRCGRLPFPNAIN